MQQIPISEDRRLQTCIDPVERDLNMLTACIKASIREPVSMPEDFVAFFVDLVDQARRSTQHAKQRIAEAKGFILRAETPEELSSLDATDDRIESEEVPGMREELRDTVKVTYANGDVDFIEVRKVSSFEVPTSEAHQFDDGVVRIEHADPPSVTA